MDFPSFFRRLKERKLVQWTVAYLAGALICLEGFDIVAEQFQWALWVQQAVTIGLLFGLLVTLVLAWHHGEKGRQQVSGGELAVLVLILAAAGVSVMAIRGRSQHQAGIEAAGMPFPFQRNTPHERSVAILPCTDMSQEQDQEYFAHGLADELTTRLNTIHDLRVTDRTSAFSFKETSEDIRTIAANLNARNILQCTVWKDGNRVRITAFLVDAEEGIERWSDRYDAELGDFLDLQEEISLAVARALEAELANDERDRLAARGTESQEAHDLYLRGISYQWRQPWSPENQNRALELFQAAVEADSMYAEAWALLATSYVVFGNFHAIAPEEAYTQAEVAANRAIALNENLAYAHWALGWVKFTFYDWEGGEAEFRRTIALAPNDFTGYHSLTFPLSVSGRFEEAKAAAQEAISLDPLALWPRVGLSEVLYKMGDFQGLIADLEASLALEPDDPFSLMNLAVSQAQVGAFEDAISAAAEAESLAPENPGTILGAANVYAIIGDVAAARERLHAMEAEAEAGNPAISPGALAMVYASLGEADRMFELLNRAVDTYDPFTYCLHYPEFRPYRGDPRFGALLDRLGLPREAYR